MNIPFIKPAIEQEDLDRMRDSVASGWLAGGPYMKQFETAFASYLGAPDAVMVNSCASALHLAVHLAGIGPGDEVITTPMSYVATSNAVLLAGGTPVFVDIDPTTGLIDLNLIEAAITPRTKAILPVHLNGLMVDMQALEALAKKHNLLIIEDAAHAVESKRDGIVPGEKSFAACFSFHAAKNLSCGQGGAVVSRDPAVNARGKVLRRNGVVTTETGRQMVDFGFKYDSTDFQAALLIGQLARITKTHAARWERFQRYAEAFQHLPNAVQAVPPNVVHAAHMFTLWTDETRRDGLRKHLQDAGIETSVHYEAIPQEPYYVKRFGFTPGQFPHAERMGKRVVTLPLYPSLTKDEQDYIIKTVLAY